jgi:putative selenium metabolism protein SsnA
MKKVIYTGQAVFTNDPDAPYFDQGAVVLKDGVIEDIGEVGEIKRAHPDATEEILGIGLITPGLVNLHHHLYSSFARGWKPSGEPPRNFPEILDRVWWRLDKALGLDDIHFSALTGLCESVLSGVTAVVDHHAGQGNPSGSLEMIAAAYDKIGIPGSVCFELSDRDGKEIFDKGLRENLNAISKWNKPENRLTAMMGLHASMTLSDESLEAVAKASKGADIGYHFHLAEDKSDQKYSLSKYGKRVTERFAEFGLLNEKSLAIHGVHLENQEISLLKEHKTNLVLCPRSNQNNAVGFPRWWEFDGLKIGLGTDGIGSDILNEARSALYLSRYLSGNPNLGFSETGNLLLNNNPEIFEKITGVKTGLIQKGSPADMVFWRYDPPTPITSENIWGHYLYGLSGLRAESVWSDGRRILRDGVFTEFDYDEILCRARILAKSLWERI